MLCCTGRERLRYNNGNFLRPRNSDFRDGGDSRCGQSGQRCIFGNVLQISFAASVVQREFGSVMQAAFSLPLSETAAHLLKMGHEEPVPHPPIHETRQANTFIRGSGLCHHPRTRAAELVMKSTHTGNFALQKPPDALANERNCRLVEDQ